MDSIDCFVQSAASAEMTTEEKELSAECGENQNLGFSHAITSANEMDIDTDVPILQGNIEELMKEDVFKVQTSFERVMWTLEYLKSNPSQTKEDEILDVCKSVEKMVILSGLQWSDMEYKRLQRIIDALFRLIQSLSCGASQEFSAATMKRVYDELEIVFDNLLDQINEKNLSAENQLIRYSYVQGILTLTEDKNIRKLVVVKLVLRIRSLTKRMWEAYIFSEQQRPKSKDKKKAQQEHQQACYSTWKLIPQDTNAYYYYCQMLETMLTITSPDEEKWIEAPVLEILQAIEDECSPIFHTFPNFKFILYPSIVAASRQVVKEGVTLSCMQSPSR